MKKVFHNIFQTKFYRDSFWFCVNIDQLWGVNIVNAIFGGCESVLAQRALDNSLQIWIGQNGR